MSFADSSPPYPPRNPLVDPKPREPLGPDGRPAPAPDNPHPAADGGQPGHGQS